MFLTLLIYVIIPLFIYYAYKYMFYKPPNFPPGPPRIPIFGSYLFVLFLNFNHSYKAVEKLYKYYNTDILGLYFGNVPSICIRKIDDIKVALGKTQYDGRPSLMLAKLRSPDFKIRGVFFTDGELWKEQKKYNLKHLRDFGFGKRLQSLEIHYRDEITEFIEMIKNGPKYDHEKKLMKDGNVLCFDIFFGLLGNCILHILSNDRYPRADQDGLIGFGQSSAKFLELGDDFGRIFSVIPWIGHICPELSGFAPARDAASNVFKFVKVICDEQIKTHDKSIDRHYLDRYIKDYLTVPEEKKEDSYKQMLFSFIDFMFPSMTGTNVQLTFLIRSLIANPHVLRKCQEEIDRVVGSGRLPTLDDRPNLPYTEATLREGFRYDILVPSGIPHRATESFELLGYQIPKDSFFVASLTTAHNDNEKFENADKFMPERFLDEDGTLSLKKDTTVAFGLGNRACAGEIYVRNILFLLLTALCQNFNMRIAPGEKLPTRDNSITGVIVAPPRFWVKFESR